MSDEISLDELLDAMHDLIDEYRLDTVAIVVNTSQIALTITMCVGAPTVIEDMDGNSFTLGDVIE